ncbi:MBL fold metallo-hydrolase [Chitinibacteraceae bacterium HSL-7]
MEIRVLGCSGGIGAGLRTTALLLDACTLIDAGTGVGDLPLDELARIDDVFLTHAHMDHIACLPMLIDTVMSLRTQPLRVHATLATLGILKQHVFNWMVWPDFTAIPDHLNPAMVFLPMEEGESRVLPNGTRITALPALHTVPAVGYALDDGVGTVVFSGDTCDNDEMWQAINALPRLDALIVETAFPNADEALARLSRHFSPRMLADALPALTQARTIDLYVTHFKPAAQEQTMAEVLQACDGYRVLPLEGGSLLRYGATT